MTFDKRYEKKSTPRKIEIIEDGIILPRIESTELTDEIRWGLGGVLDREDSYVAMSFYDGGWAKHGGYYDYDKNQIEYIDEDVVYIGLFHSHWGHFLIDCITRCWYIYRLAKETKSFKVVYLGEEIIEGNNLRFFELMGIRKEQLIQVRKPTRCKRIIVPEQGFKSCDWYTQEHLEMLDGVVKNSLESKVDFSKVDKLDKVYFTRRAFSKAIQSEFGEEYFERTFLKNGYHAIAPEKLSLDEQIYIWNHASSICCVNGSIPLNVIFASNDRLELIVLNKTSILHENPYILLQMRTIRTVFLDVYKEPLKKYPKSLGEGPFLFFATNDFMEYMNRMRLESLKTRSSIKAYFIWQELKYVLYIIGIKRKIRMLLSKLVPELLKRKIRQFCH